MSIDPIRVMLVDDHALLRDGLRVVLESESDVHIVGEATNGREAVELYRQVGPAIILMDIQMPELGGIEAMQIIRSEFPNASVIVLTTYKGDMQALRALRAGARGYLLKSSLRRELVETIRAVAAGRKRIPPEIAEEIAEHACDGELTQRELDVLRRVAMGNSNKVVAAQLSVSDETVKAHMKSIMSKLGARDRTHAVTISIKRGIIDV